VVPSRTYIEAENVAAVLGVFVAAVEVAVVVGGHREVHGAGCEGGENGVVAELWSAGVKVGAEAVAEGEASAAGKGGEGIP